MAARIKRRVEGSDSASLLQWLDMAASGVQRHLDDFRREPDEAHLAEIKLAALTMDAVADELGVRVRQMNQQS